ncbi:MlaD family protein [Jeongeupia naejangsanensis]|uniref:MCE family protein n=1 Tax=Jeongeupia naejangsanensis TaxID=613195 RepID=A0ABS2BKQ2_9NEIS|nr:MlaD family protein [Jeongeupia naejangsanensis]MBM3116190.1 MCE family protein [Jeongeupia naejangsanensis]
MTPRQSHIRLGLFVTLALALALVLLIAFGAGRWFSNAPVMETYFNESVKGLDVGSSVRYRGVAIGEVSKIGFAASKYPEAADSSWRHHYVLVEMRLRPETLGPRADATLNQHVLDGEIARGLRVRIAPQGLTGANYLEIDYIEGKPSPVLPINWKPTALYVPSARSTVGQLLNATQSIAEKLEKLDLQTMVDKVSQAADTVDSKLNAMPLEEIGRNTQKATEQLAAMPLKPIGDETLALVRELRQNNVRLGTLLADPALASAPADLQATLKSANALLANPAWHQSLDRLNHSLGEIDRLLLNRNAQLGHTLDNLYSGSSELDALLRDIRANPSSLLFSEPPPAYPLPQR